MKKIDEKALYLIKEIALKSDSMLTDANVKAHQGKLDVEKDLYPIGSNIRNIAWWVDAIIENQKS